MPDHSSDTPVRARATSVDTVAGSIGVETSTVGSPAPRRSRRARRTDWRLGGRTVRTWREGLLAVALVALGLGMLAGVGAQQLGAPPVVGTALPWAGMLVAIVIAFTRSRPVGLLRVRPIDLLWAVGLGLALRLAEGWLQAASGDATLPSLTTVDGHLPCGWWVDGVLAPVLVAPAIESSSSTPSCSCRSTRCSVDRSAASQRASRRCSSGARSSWRCMRWSAR